MQYINKANEAIESAGGIKALSIKLNEYKGYDDLPKMRDRVRKWRNTGIPVEFLYAVSKFSNVEISELIPR